MALLGVEIPSILVEIFRLSVWLTVVIVIFVPLERMFELHPQKILRKEFWIDLAYYFINSLCQAALLSVPMAVLAWSVRNFVPIQLHSLTGSLPIWARVGLGLVAAEVGYYWAHRWSHENLFLWRFHSIHHSAEQMDFLVGTRAHPLDTSFSHFLGLVPVYILGLGGPASGADSLVPLLIKTINTLWGFFIHANLRWRFGPLEYLVATPAFHHWHHTLTGPIDRNYSATLPWLDWLFGTLHLPKDTFPDAYGVVKKIPETLDGQLVYPLFLQVEITNASVSPLGESSGAEKTDGVLEEHHVSLSSGRDRSINSFTMTLINRKCPDVE